LRGGLNTAVNNVQGVFDMKKTFKQNAAISLRLIAIIALVAMVGFSMAACDDGNGPGGGRETPNLDLNGNWKLGNEGTIRITISGSTGRFTYLGDMGALWNSAKSKGYINIGDYYFRNLSRDGDLRWKGQTIKVTYNSPNVANGTIWGDCFINMDTTGKSFIFSATDSNGTQTRTWYRY
jgi:hypothetical protein